MEKNKKAVVVRSSFHPVVKQYMDILFASFLRAGGEVNDILPNEKLEGNPVVVTDSPLVAIKYFLKGYRDHCVWYQGICPEESFMSRHSWLRFHVLSFIEKFVMKRAKLLLFVSDEMRRFYERKYKISLDSKSCIMPCFNELGVSKSAFDTDKYKNNTFVYVGSLFKWQCFEETVKFYAAIEKASDYTTKLFVYTFQQKEAKELLSKYGVRNCEVDCVDASELSERIKGIKYGFVLREDNPVNNVATPTKLSNYISNGIIPIYSKAIRSFAEYDAEASVGVVCDLDDIETGVSNVLSHMKQDVSAEEMKEKCEAAFADYYCRERYVDKISEKVKKLL